MKYETIILLNLRTVLTHWLQIVHLRSVSSIYSQESFYQIILFQLCVKILNRFYRSTIQYLLKKKNDSHDKCIKVRLVGSDGQRHRNNVQQCWRTCIRYIRSNKAGSVEFRAQAGDNTRNAVHESLHLKRPRSHDPHTSLGLQSGRRDFPKLKRVIIGSALSRVSGRARVRFHGPVTSVSRKSVRKRAQAGTHAAIQENITALPHSIFFKGLPMGFM